MEQESYVNDKPFNPPFTHKNRSSKCLVYILILVVFLSISFLISWRVLLKIKTPTLQLSTVNIEHLYYDSSSLNMTIVGKIDLHNPNFGPFKFFGGPMTLLRDIGLGLIKLGSFAEVTGEVRVVKIIHRHVSAVMDCSMDLNLKSQGIQDLLCR
ncbi:hypothetical protein CDL12_20191 [Handroanthus impetiginosus]|uniref:Late embryogenesis abundant protein LEA-2 subgroup domain-containing protein n=1 Tax=Handroanthus impetiginosus TaxID=429701 RepID=A0A2G9GPQ3_9LAMI|nr:hypothetical protein CDL12_20191 [Handroanthus impetiginosus]